MYKYDFLNFLRYLLIKHMEKKHKNLLNQEKVIEQFINKHGLLYDYSKLKYNGDNKNVIITCFVHGDFEQTPSNHKKGQKCPKCSGKNLTINEIKEKLLKKHNNYYRYDKFIKIVKSSEKIIITCPIHGDFEQTLNNHMRGQGCKKCKCTEQPTIDKILTDFKLTHNDKYCYDKVNYVSAHKKIIITCPIHGDFEQTPNNHKNGNGCPVCKDSNGEKKIHSFLTNNNINFIRQHKFNNCKNILPLPFDFYLPDHNICIEYNGVQHYKPVAHFGGVVGFNQRKINDNIKNEYCYNNNIHFLIIKYSDNTLNILSKYFNI